MCQDSPLRLTTTSAFVLLATLPVKIVRSVSKDGSNTLFINVPSGVHVSGGLQKNNNCLHISLYQQTLN